MRVCVILMVLVVAEVRNATVYAQETQFGAMASRHAAVAKQKAKRSEANFNVRCLAASTNCSYANHPRRPTAFYVNGVLVDFQPAGQVLMVFCLSSGVLELASLPQYSYQLRVREVVVYNCERPQKSYADMFAAINVKVPQRLMLTWFTNTNLATGQLHLQRQHFEGLQRLDSLELSIATPDEIVSVSGDVLLHLDNLRMLVALRVRIFLPLSGGSRVRELTLRHGGPAGSGEAGPLGECAQLRNLTVTDWNATSLPRGWLADCTRLERVWLERLPVTRLPAEMITGASSLRVLTVRNCSHLTDISPQFISNAMQLRELDFSHNSLLLSRENPETMEFLHALPHMPKLHRIDLRATGAQQLHASCWDTIHNLFISYMKNHVKELTYHEMRLIRTRRWQVDLRGNPLRTVRYTRTDYEAALTDVVTEGSNTSALWIDSELECDCRSYWFARALRERPEHAPRLPRPLRCSARSPLPQARGPLAGVSLDAMVCRRSCAEGCECYERGHDAMILANCTGSSLVQLLRVANLTELHAQHSAIDTLHADDFPETLDYLDVRDNKISRVEGAAVSALFGARARRALLLAGNPLACDCRAKPLLDALHQHIGQVVDYGSVKCADGRAVHDVSTIELCRDDWMPGLVAALAGVLTIMLLALVAVVVYHRNERAVKVFLYARGWCQCWVDEEEVDRDKRYDAFVTFAHADERFVEDELLPGLERGPHALSVCVHYRDWVVGDTIPEQISRSVAESRRTIAVMSRHFLASVWTRAEFRTAHALALSEGRPRLVVVMLEEVAADERLDDELRAYLATNTYVKWGDPRFWDKLLYVMPHRPFRRTCKN